MQFTTYLYDVLSPMMHPVQAVTGDVILVRPGHPERPIVVMRSMLGGWRPVRGGPPNYGAILVQEDDGIIRWRASAAAASVPLSTHPLVARSA